MARVRRLRHYVGGRWQEPGREPEDLVDPTTEEVVAHASSAGVDVEAALDHARRVGGPALRALTFAERGRALKKMSKALREQRQILIELSKRNAGTTEADSAFDVDGGSGTLAFYANLGEELGDTTVLEDGAEITIGKDSSLGGRHCRVSRKGAAVLLNAFNFPVWGFAEKASCALLAGMPIIVKPATPTALVTAKCIEILLEGMVLPDGALQLICGSGRELVSSLGPQDVVAFTGGAETARVIRSTESFLRSGWRLNVEADSINAAVLGEDVDRGSATFELFCRDVAKEMTQKTGQKCTAVRRILTPRSSLAGVMDGLIAEIEKTVVGSPFDDRVTMGPLTTRQVLEDVREGVAVLESEAKVVFGTGETVEAIRPARGEGYFFGPVLLVLRDGGEGRMVHQREVFGPVATVIPYSSGPSGAGELVARAGGTLVTSVYTDDREWTGEFASSCCSWAGRLFIGSQESAAAGIGSGVVLPQVVHGGPGHAGDGEEVGGLRGLSLYMQRVALQGHPRVTEAVQGYLAAKRPR